MPPTRKVAFSLDELRVRTFDSAPEAESGKGTVRAHQECAPGCSSCSGCSGCTNCTQCSACSGCTTCPPPFGGACSCSSYTVYRTY